MPRVNTAPFTGLVSVATAGAISGEIPGPLLGRIPEPIPEPIKIPFAQLRPQVPTPNQSPPKQDYSNKFRITVLLMTISAF